jgi:transporter family-2 protein
VGHDAEARPCRRDQPVEGAAGADDAPGPPLPLQGLKGQRSRDARRRVHDQRHRPLGVEPQPLGATGVAGALAVVAGASLIVRAQASGAAVEAALRGGRAWLALAVAAGAVLPFQGAINAHLRADLGAPITVGAFSFLVATAAMALVLAAALGLAGAAPPRVEGLRRVPWWGWLGGLCGATYVTSVFLLIPRIGVAPTVALTVAGQQVASVLVDRYGLLRLPRRGIAPLRLAGVGLLLAGVGLIEIA